MGALEALPVILAAAIGGIAAGILVHARSRNTIRLLELRIKSINLTRGWDAIALEAQDSLVTSLERLLAEERLSHGRAKVDLGMAVTEATVKHMQAVLANRDLLHACKLVAQNAPRIREWLQQNDPKALEQVEAAIAKAEAAHGPR